MVVMHAYVTCECMCLDGCLCSSHSFPLGRPAKYNKDFHSVAIYNTVLNTHTRTHTNRMEESLAKIRRRRRVHYVRVGRYSLCVYCSYFVCALCTQKAQVKNRRDGKVRHGWRWRWHYWATYVFVCLRTHCPSHPFHHRLRFHLNRSKVAWKLYEIYFHSIFHFVSRSIRPPHSHDRIEIRWAHSIFGIRYSICCVRVCAVPYFRNDFCPLYDYIYYIRIDWPGVSEVSPNVSVNEKAKRDAIWPSSSGSYSHKHPSLFIYVIVFECLWNIENRIHREKRVYAHIWYIIITERPAHIAWTLNSQSKGEQKQKQKKPSRTSKKKWREVIWILFGHNNDAFIVNMAKGERYTWTSGRGENCANFSCKSTYGSGSNGQINLLSFIQLNLDANPFCLSCFCCCRCCHC